jgi:hyaluronan synthase
MRLASRVSEGDQVDLWAKAFILAGLLGLIFWAYLTQGEFEAMFARLRSNSLSEPLLVAAYVLFLVNAAALIWRIVLVRRHHPTEPCSEEELPTCTVIVPAYNEGRQVLSTIRSLATSDYPGDKLRIIGVNDGSRDDTLRWLLKARAEFPRRVQVIHCPENRGKRRALYEGFRRARGEIIVTVDSDSEVAPETLRRLLSPFRRDPSIGAVAGNVRVLNRREGLLPRMLDVSYTYSFDFIRASQSMVRTVFCTPGALSAYRRDLVMRVLQEWLSQRFCGRPATIGEDRAMTNLILRSGHHVHYQSDAVVYTKVPTGYRTLCKMFLRWARSNIRETLVLSRFAFRRFRETPALGARVNLILHWIGMTVPQLLRVHAVGCLLAYPLLFGGHLLAGAALASLVPMAVYFVRHRSTNGLWAIPLGVFWLFGLSWISTYALFTPYKTGWLTRQVGEFQRSARPKAPIPVRRLARRAA